MSNEMLNNWEKDWIPIPVSILTDRRYLRVKKEFPGGAGLGLVVATWLILKQQKDFIYPVKDIDLLADQVGTSVTQLSTLVYNSGFFQIIEQEGGEKFLSPDLNVLLKPYTKAIENKKEAAKIGAKKRKIKALEQEVELKRQLSEAEKKLSQVDSSEHNITSAKLSDDSSSQHTILDNTILNDKILPYKIKNQKFKDIFAFKKYCIANISDLEFFLDKGNPFKYLTTTGFKIKDNLLFNVHTFEFLSAEEAIQIWNYLYKNPHLILGAQNENL